MQCRFYQKRLNTFLVDLESEKRKLGSICRKKVLLSCTSVKWRRKRGTLVLTPSSERRENYTVFRVGKSLHLPMFSLLFWCSWLVWEVTLWGTKLLLRSAVAPLACLRALFTWLFRRLCVAIAGFPGIPETQNACGYSPCAASPCCQSPGMALILLLVIFQPDQWDIIS